MWKSWEEKDRCEKELLYRLFCRIETLIRRFPTRKLVLTFRLPNDYFTIVAQTSSGGEGRGSLVYRGKQVGFNDSKFPFPSVINAFTISLSSSGELRFLAWWLMETEKESSCVQCLVAAEIGGGTCDIWFPVN